jgi:hypothetical protein
MGYDYAQVEARFVIPRERHAAALAAILRAYGLEPDAPGRPVITLADAFSEPVDGVAARWRWDVDLDLEGNVIGIALAYERLRLSRDLFQSIAPFVAPGSYIRIRGEEGEEWRWEFDGVTVQQIEESPSPYGQR